MGLFARLFRRTNSAPPPPAPLPLTGGGAGPTYDPGLVARLQGEHQDLVDLFTEIGKVAQEGRYFLIPPMLVRLKTMLDAHVIVENVSFYAFLERTITDPATLDTLRGFRREMNTIAHAATRFISKYKATGVNQHNPTFSK